MNEQTSMQGRFKAQVLRKEGGIEHYYFKNAVTDEGLDIILNTFWNSLNHDWYIGLIDAGLVSPTLANADTMSSHGGWAEATAYDDVLSLSVRPGWQIGTTTTQRLTNNTSPAVFTLNATTTVWGCFVTNNNTRGGSTGTLWSTGQLTDAAGAPTTIDLVDDDVMKVVYELTATRS